MGETSFTLTFKTIAQLTGLEQLISGVQNGAQQIESINTQLRSVASAANTALTALGSYLAVTKLEEYARKAEEVRKGQASFEAIVLRSKDGSVALFEALNKLNRELANTVGITEASSRAIEQQLLLFGATKDTIVPLTRNIIDFAAARTKDPQEVAMFISRALTAEDIMLGRLGIHLDKTKSHAEQVQSLIDQLGKAPGIAQLIEEATGGLGRYEIAWSRLQVAVGNFVNLVRIPFLVALTGGLQSTKEKIDSVSDSTSEWGKRIFVTAGMAGLWVGENLKLISSVAALGAGLVVLRTSIGVIGPQATAAVVGIVALGAGIQTAAQKISGVPFTWGDVFKTMGTVTVSIFEFIKDNIINFVTLIKDRVTQIVDSTLAKLGELTKWAVVNIPGLSLGIDASKVDAAIAKLKSSARDAGDEAASAASKIVESGTTGLEQLEKKLATIYRDAMKRGASDSEAKAELEKMADDYFNAFKKIQDKLKGQAGTGVIDIGGANAGAAKAAAEELTTAKFRLAQAEERYRVELEETQLLEHSGAITHDQAMERNVQSGNRYLAELERLKAALPGLIAQMEKMGNVKGVEELRLEMLKLELQIDKVKLAMGDETFFGKIHAQLLKLKNEWSDLGKQIGGFLTQQFQNFAQGAAAALTQLIFRTGNWKQTIAAVGQQFVQSLIQMVIQFALSKTVMAALNALFRAKDTAGAIQAGASAAAAWAPAATAASIATEGEGAGLGLAAVVAAMAAGVAAIIGMVGGFAQGGYTGDGSVNQIAGVVHGREFVFPASAVDFYGKNFLTSMVYGGLTRPTPSSGGGGSYNAAPETNVAIFDDRQQLEKWLKSAKGQSIIIDIASRNSYRIRHTT